jgi:hypothetical protein
VTFQGTMYRWVDHVPNSLTIARVPRAEFKSQDVAIEWETPPSSAGGVGDRPLEAKVVNRFVQGYEFDPDRGEWRIFQQALHDSPSGVRLLEGT